MGICTTVLVVNLAGKSRVYTTFTLAHPKACSRYSTVVYSSPLLTILVNAKCQHLYVLLLNVSLLYTIYCIMFLNSPSSVFVK